MFSLLIDTFLQLPNQTNGKDLSYVELYDIAADVYEKNDLKEAHIEIVEKLIAQIEEWKNGLPEKPSEKLFSKERINFSSRSFASF